MNKNGTVFKSSGVEWVGDVPDHWQVCKIKRLSPVKRGASPRPIDDPKFFDDDGEFSWVRISDVTASRKYLTQTTQKLSPLGSSSSVKLEPETFFVSIAASVGKPIITRIKCCIHDGFVYFPYLKINPDFLYYLFDGGQLFQGLGKLGTQLNLNTETIGSIHIPLPPNDEIQLIVDYLDRETTQIDNLIAAKEQMLTLLEEKREALISHAVTRGLDPNVAFKRSGLDWLGDIPQHWDVIRLKHLAKEALAYGANEAALEDNPRYPRFIRITDIKDDGSLRPETFKSLSPEVAKPYLLNDGDVLLARSGATVGKAFIYRKEWGTACFAGYLIRCRSNKELLIPSFLFYYTQSSSYWSQVYAGTIQATIQNFSGEKYGDIFIPIPPLSEQKDVLNFLDYETSKLDGLLGAIKESIALLKERRSALITAAVTGQIALEEMTP